MRCPAFRSTDRRPLATLAAGFAILLAACSGPAEPVPRRASSGPPTLVSLNPCLDAIAVEIAAPEQILALSHYSRDTASSSIPPAQAAAFRTIGGTAEEVVALDPDVVLASHFIDPATARALERAGLRVETFGSPRTVAESIAQVRRVGEVTGAPARSEALVSQLVAATSPAAGDQPSVVLWQPGQIVPGGDTLVSRLLREAGFASHSEAIGLGQADHLSLEQMLADPPDVLLVAGDSPGQAHPLLSAMDATRVEPFAQRLLYCGGPTIVAARARLAEIRDAPGRARR